jgi:endonuclease-3
MAAKRLVLAKVLSVLQKQYGKPRAPVPQTPFEWVLWENVAYLVDDERREIAFRALGKRTGFEPQRIASASAESLLAVTRLGGMHPEARVDRLKEIAALALELGGGALEQLHLLPPAQAQKQLARFPSIGAPGAQKILMACGAGAALALESNGLRVLLRLGFGMESKNYAASYRSVQEALAEELPAKPAARLAAHLLLRTHGQTLCKRNAPDCDACPLAARCPSSIRRVRAPRPLVPRAGPARLCRFPEPRR